MTFLRPVFLTWSGSLQKGSGSDKAVVFRPNGQTQRTARSGKRKAKAAAFVVVVRKKRNNKDGLSRLGSRDLSGYQKKQEQDRRRTSNFSFDFIDYRVRWQTIADRESPPSKKVKGWRRSTSLSLAGCVFVRLDYVSLISLIFILEENESFDRVTSLSLFPCV